MPKVLIVDDDEPSRRLLAKVLERGLPCRVVEANDGREALERASSEKPALVLMDLALPDMDGLEVVRALKLHRELQDVPVIAVTAYTQRADEERARTGGCAGFLAKPVKLGELLRMARSLLGLDP